MERCSHSAGVSVTPTKGDLGKSKLRVCLSLALNLEFNPTPLLALKNTGATTVNATHVALSLSYIYSYLFCGNLPPYSPQFIFSYIFVSKLNSADPSTPCSRASGSRCCRRCSAEVRPVRRASCGAWNGNARGDEYRSAAASPASPALFSKPVLWRFCFS